MNIINNTSSVIDIGFLRSNLFYKGMENALESNATKIVIIELYRPVMLNVNKYSFLNIVKSVSMRS